MSIKFVGATMVMLSCSICGFSISFAYKYEEKLYCLLIQAIQSIIWELQYRLTSLPDLCIHASKNSKGIVKAIFHDMAAELNNQMLPDVSSCMRIVLGRRDSLPVSVRRVLVELGQALGQYDLERQVESLNAIQKRCQTALEGLARQHSAKTREYQTLGLCAGAALVIIFI